MASRMLPLAFATLLLATTISYAQNSPTLQLPPSPPRDRATFQPGLDAPKYAPERILVRFRPETPKPRTEAAHSAIAAQVIRSSKLVRGLDVVRLPEKMTIEAALHAYRQDPAVLYAEPDYVMHVLQNPVTPNDTLFAQQWALRNTGQNGGVPRADIRGPEAWSLSTGSPNVVVGVIDTGIDYNHEDLNAKMFRNTLDCNSNGIDDDGNGFVDDCYGIDTANGDSDPMDDHGHGTHVAGIIGAAGNNGIGVVGVSWQVKLLACKFINSGGWGYESDAIACLDYMAAMKDRGVNIVATNNSWGGDAFSWALLDAIDVQRQKGILFIAAAGNQTSDNDSSPFFPAGYYLPNIIAVGATDSSDLLAGFSNFGRRSVHLSAPGTDILSTTPGNTYSLFSGTSMATPHVAGVAALLAAQDPTRDWKAIKNLLLAGGDTIPSLSSTVSQKRLNAYGAMTCKDSIIRSRILPRTTITTAAVGLPVDLAVLHINCGNSNGAVTVSLDGGTEVIPLRDDGLGADQEASDGIYSGQWTPSATGSHTLAFPDGDIVAVQVLSPYRFSTTDFAWRTIAGTPLKLDESELGGRGISALISSPFPIRFGGGSFDGLYVNSKGNISFTASFHTPVVEPIPTPATSALVAPFWDDLALFQFNDNSTSPADAYWGVLGAAPSRELVIEWRDVSHMYPPANCLAGFCTCDGRITFQVVFFEGRSEILFNYADVVFADPTRLCGIFNQGRYASVGVQVAPRVGTQFSYAIPSLTDGFAILWEIGNAVPALTQLSPFTALTTDSALSVKLLGSNFVPGASGHWNDAAIPTTFVTSSELQVAPSAADLSAPGRVQLSVINPGGGLSNSLPFDVYSAYPLPKMTGVSSPVLEAYSPGPRQIDVYGSQFVTGSVVRWNGSDRPTTAFNSTKLTAEIPESDYAVAGTAQVTVFNPSPGGGTSNATTVQIVNPVPFIFGPWPSFASAGSPDFTLTIDSPSDSFVPASVVRWNGKDRPTTLVSRWQVHAAISASDVARAGTAEVTVFNPAPGGGTSNPLKVDIVTPPPNDNFVNAIEAQPLPFKYIVDDRGATIESTDPIPSCSYDISGTVSRTGTVWYKYTASRDIHLLGVADRGAWSSQVLSVWAGTPGSFGEVACGSTWSEAVRSPTVLFTATAGKTYYFMLNKLEGYYYPEPALTFFLAEVNAGPTIDSLSPSSTVAGGPAFNLTINGSGFALNSVLQWNGMDQSTTFVNTTQLIASIGANLIAREGTAQITVYNSNPDGTSRAFPFNITPVPPSIQFELAVTRTGGGVGMVTSDPAGIDCGATCSASFASGTLVSLTAMPTSGSTFAGWSGGCVGPSPCVVNMNAKKNVTAAFDVAPPFDFGAAPAPNTITAGQSAQFLIQMVGQPSFVGTVSFVCSSGVPQAAACSFNPTSVSFGVGNTTTTLTVTTTPRNSAALRVPSVTVYASLLLPLIFVTRVRRFRQWTVLICFGITLVALGTMVACGGSAGTTVTNNPPNGTPAGSYSIKVIATSGGVSRDISVTLTVR